MAKIKQTIRIVSSSVEELSSMSLPSREAIRDVLSQHYTDVSIQLVDNLADLKRLVASRPDLVFLGMKFIPSNPSLGINDPDKIWLSHYLESRGIACTGSTSQAHSLELNKPLAKQQVLDSGLNTSAYLAIRQDKVEQTPENHGLRYPLFVKPTNRGGGLGVDAKSLVSDYTELISKARQIADELKSDALVEEFLPGREFSVSILRKSDNLQYRIMPIELVVPADDRGVTMLAGDVKSDNNEQISKVSDPELAQKICDLAIGAFKSIGGRDYGRIDIRLDSAGQPSFLEANLIPSLIDNYGSFPKSCAMYAGLSHADMILKITRLAMLRQSTARPRLLETLLATAKASSV